MGLNSYEITYRDEDGRKARFYDARSEKGALVKFCLDHKVSEYVYNAKIKLKNEPTERQKQDSSLVKETVFLTLMFEALIFFVGVFITMILVGVFG